MNNRLTTHPVQTISSIASMLFSGWMIQHVVFWATSHASPDSVDMLAGAILLPLLGVFKFSLDIIDGKKDDQN